MVQVQYLPSRKIFESNNTFDFDVETFSSSISRNARETETLGGLSQTALYYIREGFSVKSVWLEGDDTKRMEEFLYSVSGGEVFNINTPDDELTFIPVKLDGEFSKERLSFRTNYFAYSFTVKPVAVIN